MKKSILKASIICLAFFSIISCRESNSTETVTREVEVEKETEPVEEREGILERSAKKVDAKVNKEIDEEIDKIGDDN